MNEDGGTIGREAFIHDDARVLTDNVGVGTTIWQFSVVLEGARIGNWSNICSHCFLENDVTVGDRVTIKNGVYLWDGIRIEDDVFVGANVNFTNDKNPKSKNADAKLQETFVKKGASIGAGATILPGLTIGKYAMVGAGAVVTKDVEDGRTVLGNPAAERLENSAGPAWRTFTLPEHRDERGSLISLENGREIPFELSRVYYLFGTNSSALRGQHAHLKLQQVLIATSGALKVRLHDGLREEIVELSSPIVGLYIGPGVWRELYDFSDGSVCMVLASRPYESDDYIRTFDDFIAWRNGV